MKRSTPYFILLILSLFFVQCKQDNSSSITGQKVSLSYNLIDSVHTNPDWSRTDYERCIRYANEDYDLCEKSARRSSGLKIFGITLFIGIVYSIYKRRISALFIALFLGFLFGVMNYGLESKFCKKTLEKELGRCEEIWIPQ